MVYLEQFRFPDAEVEFDFFLRQKRTCYDTYYPFQILSKHRFEQIDFEPVTILYGGYLLHRVFHFEQLFKTG